MQSSMRIRDWPLTTGLLVVLGGVGSQTLHATQDELYTAQAASALEAGSRQEMYERYLDFPSLIKGASARPHWLADGRGFWYAEGAPDRTVIFKVDPAANQKIPLFDVDRLRQALAPVLGHEPPYEGLPFESFTFADDERSARFVVEDREFELRLANYEIEALPAGSRTDQERLTPQLVRRAFPTTEADLYELPSPDGNWFVRDQDHNLWLRSTEDGRLAQLTSDGEELDAWSTWDTKWSPDGNKILTRRVDSRGAHRMPVVHWLKPGQEEVEWHLYPIAGGSQPQNRLLVVDIHSKRRTEIDVGDEPDQIFHLIGWGPTGNEVFFLRLDRLMKRMDLMAADPDTGASRVVVSEQQETYVEGLRFYGVADDFLTLLDDGRFLWLSERDGWTHLYLYEIDGTLVRRLTQGAFPVSRVVAVDAEAGWIYLMAQAEPDRPYDAHLYRVDFDGGGWRRLTEGAGQHQVEFAPTDAYFVDTHSSASRPPVTELRRADGDLLQVLSRRCVGHHRRNSSSRRPTV